MYQALPCCRLDPATNCRLSCGMTRFDPVEQLQALADRVERLVERNARLAAENRTLRASQEQLAVERAQLLAKNEMARTRVEAMIARLRSLEQHT